MVVVVVVLMLMLMQTVLVLMQTVLVQRMPRTLHVLHASLAPQAAHTAGTACAPRSGHPCRRSKLCRAVHPPTRRAHRPTHAIMPGAPSCTCHHARRTLPHVPSCRARHVHAGESDASFAARLAAQAGWPQRAVGQGAGPARAGCTASQALAGQATAQAQAGSVPWPSGPVGALSCPVGAPAPMLHACASTAPPASGLLTAVGRAGAPAHVALPHELVQVQALSQMQAEGRLRGVPTAQVLHAAGVAGGPGQMAYVAHVGPMDMQAMAAHAQMENRQAAFAWYNTQAPAGLGQGVQGRLGVAAPAAASAAARQACAAGGAAAGQARAAAGAAPLGGAAGQARAAAEAAPAAVAGSNRLSAENDGAQECVICLSAPRTVGLKVGGWVGCPK